MNVSTVRGNLPPPGMRGTRLDNPLDVRETKDKPLGKMGKLEKIGKSTIMTNMHVIARGEAHAELG